MNRTSNSTPIAPDSSTVTAESWLYGDVTAAPVKHLIDEPPDSAAREQGERFLSSDLGLFPPGETGPTPTPTAIEEGSLVASASDQRAESAGLDIPVGPFVLEWADEPRVRTIPPRIRSNVRWIVSMDIDQARVASLRPTPSRLYHDGSHTIVKWHFPPGGAAPVRVSLRPPWAVMTLGDLNHNEWSGVRLIPFLVLSLLFLPVFGYLLHRHGSIGAGDRADRELVRRQLGFLLAAAALVLITGLASEAKGQLLVGNIGGYDTLSQGGRLAVDVFPHVAAVAFAMLVFSAGRRRGAGRGALAFGVTASAVFVLLDALSAFGPLDVTAEEVAGWHWPLSVAGLVVWGLLSFCLFNGVLRVVLSWVDADLGRGGMLSWVDADPGPPPRGSRRSRQAAVGSVLLTAAVATTSAVAYSSQGFDLLDDADILVPSSVTNIAIQVAPLLPVILLPAAVRLLHRSSPSMPFVVLEAGPWLLALALFLFFVVPPPGGLAGFYYPGSLLIAIVVLAVVRQARRFRLEQVEQGVRELNGREAPGEAGSSVLAGHLRELIDRTLLIERVQRLRTGAHQKQAKSDEGGEAFIAYRERLAELDSAERYLQRGEVGAERVASEGDRALVRLRFPEKPPLIYVSLACGPGRSWRENARVALRYGSLIALAPIAYVVYVLLKHGVGHVFDPVTGLEPLLVVVVLASQVALWFAAAYVFGCLFTWLPWGNGALKGFVLSLPVIAGFALTELCSLYVGPTDWTFRAFEVLFFLSLLGLLMDLRTVRDAGLRWRDLFDLYQIRSLRFGIVNLAPLLVAGLGIYQEFRAGNPQGAVEHAVKAAGGGGLGGRRTGVAWRLAALVEASSPQNS